jgi:hypothetical protein
MPCSAARSPARHYRLDGRDSRLVSTVGRLDEFVPDSALVRALPRRSSRGARPAVVDLYLHWPDLPEDDDELRRAHRRGPVGSTSWPRVRRIAIGVVRGDGRGRLFHLPARRRRQPHRGSRRPRHASDGGPPTRPVATARLRPHPARRAPGRAALRVRRPGQPGRSPARSPWRRCASSSWCATTTARSSGCPTSSGPWPTAWRRSAARTGAGGAGARLDMNQVWIHIWPLIDADVEQLTALRARIAPMTAGAGIEEVLIEGRIAAAGRTKRPDRRALLLPGRRGRHLQRRAARHRAAGSRWTLCREGPARQSPGLGLPLRAAVAAHRRRRQLRRVRPRRDRVAWCPSTGRPARTRPASSRPRSPRRPRSTPRASPGSLLAGDPTKGLGAVAEAECARIIAGLDLAEELGVPVEWFALSAGARISMDSGTENMDWVAAALRRIVEFTQAGTRSTSSSRASTSAPSPTGTPRRRCSCTPRASSS